MLRTVAVLITISLLITILIFPMDKNLVRISHTDDKEGDNGPSLSTVAQNITHTQTNISITSYAVANFSFSVMPILVLASSDYYTIQYVDPVSSEIILSINISSIGKPCQVCVGNLDEDPYDEVYVLMDYYDVDIFDENGTKIGHIDLPFLTNRIYIADLDNDEKSEIIGLYTGGNSKIAIIDGATLSVVNTLATGINRFGENLALGDYDGDSLKDIYWFVTTTSSDYLNITVIGGDNYEVITSTYYAMEDIGYFRTRLFDFDNDSRSEVLLVRDKIYLCEDNLSVILEEPLNLSYPYCDQGTYDGDGDKFYEAYYLFKNNTEEMYLVAVEPHYTEGDVTVEYRDLTQLWGNFDAFSTYRASRIANVTNNANLDFILSTYDYLVIYDLSEQIIVDTIYTGDISSSRYGYLVAKDFNGDNRIDTCLIFKGDNDILTVISDVEAPELLTANIEPTVIAIGSYIDIELSAWDHTKVFRAKVELVDPQGKIKEKEELYVSAVDEHLSSCNGIIVPRLPGDYSIRITIEDPYFNKAVYCSDNFSLPTIKVIGYVHLEEPLDQFGMPIDICRADLDNDSLDELVLVSYKNPSTKMCSLWFLDVINDSIIIENLCNVTLSADTENISVLKIVCGDINSDGIDDVAILLSAHLIRDSSSYFDQFVVLINGSTKIPTASMYSILSDFPSDKPYFWSLEILDWSDEGYPLLVLIASNATYSITGQKLIDIPTTLESILTTVYVKDNYDYLFLVGKVSGEENVGILYRVDYERHVIDALGEVSYNVSPRIFVVNASGYNRTVLIAISTNFTVYNPESLEELFDAPFEGDPSTVIFFDMDNDSLMECLYTWRPEYMVTCYRIIDCMQNTIMYGSIDMDAIGLPLFWDDNTKYDLVFISTINNELGVIPNGNASDIKKIILTEDIDSVAKAFVAKILNISRAYQQVIALAKLYNGEEVLLIISNIEYLRHPILHVRLGSNYIHQGETLSIILSVFDPTGKPISDGVAKFMIDSSAISYSMISYGNGTYISNISTSRLYLGIHTLTVIFEHKNYLTEAANMSFIIYGELTASCYAPTNVTQGYNMTVTIDVYDKFLNPVVGGNISIGGICGEYQYEIEANKYTIIITNVSSPIGLQYLEISIEHPFATQLDIKIPVVIIGNITARIEASNNNTVIQGEDFNLSVLIRDELGYPLNDCMLYVVFFGVEYGMRFCGDGTYTALISTTNVPAGIHKCYIHVQHDVLGYTIFIHEVEVIGKFTVSARFNSTEIVQGNTYKLTVELKDMFGYTVSNASIRISIADRVTVATEVKSGLYEANISFSGFKHGDYDIKIEIIAEHYINETKIIPIYVHVKIPELKLTPISFLVMLAMSVLISIVGLSLYYLIGKKMHMARGNIEQLGASLRMLDVTYVVTFISFIGIVFLAHAKFVQGDPSTAAALIGLSLLVSILLAGIWIYRDINKMILLEKFDKIRPMLCLWHLVVVPLLIFAIFRYGAYIEWFEAYILEDTIRVYGYSIPKLLLTLLSTYIGSFAVLIVNLYRDCGRTIRKIEFMRKEETSEDVILMEKVSNLQKFSESIRIKFLIFLALIGAAIVSTAKILQYYTIGLVVVIPILLVVVVPYLVSRVVGVLGRIVRR